MNPLIDLVRRVTLGVVAEWWRENGLTLTWAKVTATSPLRVRPVGQSDPVGSTPESLVAGLVVDDRVLAVRFGTSWVVIGKAV